VCVCVCVCICVRARVCGLTKVDDWVGGPTLMADFILTWYLFMCIAVTYSLYSCALLMLRVWFHCQSVPSIA
jgi:hypothetical protein